MVQAALLTGCRYSELTNLRCADFNTDSDTLSIRQAKGGKPRHVVITSEGGYTLWEFGQLIRRAPLGLSHAMSMDGGREAELCVRAPGFEYNSFTPTAAGGDQAVPLPAVIAVMRP